VKIALQAFTIGQYVIEMCVECLPLCVDSFSVSPDYYSHKALWLTSSVMSPLHLVWKDNY